MQIKTWAEIRTLFSHSKYLLDRLDSSSGDFWLLAELAKAEAAELSVSSKSISYRLSSSLEKLDKIKACFDAISHHEEELGRLKNLSLIDFKNLSNHFVLAKEALIESFSREELDAQLLIDSSKEILSVLRLLIANLSDNLKKIDKFITRATLLVLKSHDKIKGSHVLYHAVKEEYAQEILERGSILGHTTQRYWNDGRRLKENHEDYEDSFWMKGISMTRSLEFAINWAKVVLIFDRTKIRHKHEITPYSWNFHFGEELIKTDHKKEAEDFVVLNRTGRRFTYSENKEFMDEYQEMIRSGRRDEDTLEAIKHYESKMNRVDVSAFKEPEGEFDFAKQGALIGIILRGSTYDYEGLENKLLQLVINHPLFLGMVEKD